MKAKNIKRTKNINFRYNKKHNGSPIFDHVNNDTKYRLTEKSNQKANILRLDKKLDPTICYL